MTENEKQQLVEAVIAELKANGTDVATADIVTNADGISYIIAYNKDGNIVRIAPSTMLDKNVITWINEGSNVTNMNDFTEAGVYELKGERTRDDDNLPFENTGSGHTFHARLEVLDSSITPEGKSDDICITQKLTLSNRVAGDGDVYIRTGRGTSKQSITWETWGKLQQNIEVGEVTTLDDLIDNGIYSGVWTTGSFINTGYPTTFVCVVINDYFLGKELNNYQRKISQFVYGVTAIDGATGFRCRVKVGDNEWGDWEILNKSEIDNAFKNFRNGLEQSIDDIVTALSTQIDNVKRNAAHYNKIGFNTRADEVELYVRNITDDDVRTDTIPAATNKKAGVMSAEDKNKLEDASNEIVKIKDGNTIVGQAREIHSRNGKTVTDSFLARTTAGSGTIGDGVASLKSVGGNIVKNLAYDEINPNNKTQQAVIKIGNFWKLSSLIEEQAVFKHPIGALTPSHKYYIKYAIYVTLSVRNSITLGGGYSANRFVILTPDNIPAHQWYIVSNVLQYNPDDGFISNGFNTLYPFGVGVISIDNYAYISTPIFIDLTEMFGAGNEPTLAECDKLFATMDALPQGLTIANPSTFTSTGFNQFNPDNVLEGKAIVDNALANGDKKIAVIPCLPCKVGVGENNGYCIHGDFGDDINVYLTPLNPLEVDGELYMHKLTKDETTDTYVPQIKGYMLVEVPTTANLCAHFLWSEDKCERDTYEPYFESKVELPTIPQMSEWGLAGIQSGGTLACDEINLERGVYIKKIGCIDIGDANWKKRADSSVFYLLVEDMFIPNYWGGISPVMSAEYSSHITANASNIPDKKAMTNAKEEGRYLYIRDDAYTTAGQFKQASYGFKIYYILLEPIEYPLPKVDNNYISSDYGVEQFDSAIPCNANNLYYMRSLAGETRNFLDRLYDNTDKADAKEVADYITNGIDGNKELATNAPNLALRQLYIAAGAVYNESTGLYSLNGVDDLTDADMAIIYNYKDAIYRLNIPRVLQGIKMRAIKPFMNHQNAKDFFNAAPINGYATFTGTFLEIVRLTYSKAYTIDTANEILLPLTNNTKWNATFYLCSSLREVWPINVKTVVTYDSNVFGNCTSLIELRLFGLAGSITLADSPNISKESLLYMINNTTAKSEITISLHADAYARFAEDADIVAALAAQPLVKLQGV